MSDSGIANSGGDAGSQSGTRSGVLRGRYRIVRLLGRGGMGAVYLATDALFGDQLCAVKELLGDPAATPAEAVEAVERFAREARLLAALEHANLPKVRDYFSEQGQSYLVMEYIAGETLEQRVAREGAQSQQVVLGWAQEVCAALEYLHAQTPPIIFRDVAPDNIMVDDAGHIKLIDFGIARVFNPTKQTDTLRFGKVGYAPPEQFSGRGQTTQRSDLFALGATLHFALTGRDPADLPFVFPPLRETNPSVSAEVEQAILSAVQMDPAKRPADVRAFAEGLGLTLPAVVLPASSSALLVEVPSAPARPAQQEQRLVVFRQRDWSTQAARRVRRVIPLLVPIIVIVFVVVIALPAFLLSGMSSFLDLFSTFGMMIPFVLIVPFVALFGNQFSRRRQGQGRIALGRQGVLLLGVRPYARRKEILWEDVLAVENKIQLYGPRVELRLRLKKQMSPFGQALYKILYTSAAQMRENQANASMAQWQVAMPTASAPIMTPWSVSLAPWAYEQLAADQSPVPAMNLQEALLWYWQEPQRRAALADLPAQGQEREIALLQSAEDSRAPVTRWIGLPAWASLALLMVSLVFTTPFHLWAYPGNYVSYPVWLGLNGSGVVSLGCYGIGLALLIACANRRGWFFKAGVAAVIAGGIIQGIASFGFSFSSLDYELPNPYFPYNRFILSSSFMWQSILPFVLVFAASLLVERREVGRRQYAGGEIALLGFLPFIILLPFVLQDATLATYPATQQIGSAALLDLTMLPYVPLLILLLCYFQGRSLPAQRWTTLGVFVCGLVLTIGAPVLYLTTSAWAFIASWPGINLLALNGYWGLNLLAGVLIMGVAARRLHLLSPERGVFAALGADTRGALSSVTTLFSRRQAALPPGKID